MTYHMHDSAPKHQYRDWLRQTDNRADLLDTLVFLFSAATLIWWLVMVFGV